MVASCFGCEEAKVIVAQEVSLLNFAQYLTESLSLYSKQREEADIDKGSKMRADRWLLSHRFPVSLKYITLFLLFKFLKYFGKRNFDISGRVRVSTKK